MSEQSNAAARRRGYHELKSHPESFGPVLDGTKRHEVRVFDRDYQEGDRILMREWNPATSAYTGRQWTGRIGQVTKPGEWGLDPSRNIGCFTIIEEM